MDNKQVSLTCPNCEQTFEAELGPVDFNTDTGRLTAMLNALDEFDDIQGVILCPDCSKDTKDSPKVGNWYIL